METDFSRVEHGERSRLMRRRSFSLRRATSSTPIWLYATKVRFVISGKSLNNAELRGTALKYARTFPLFGFEEAKSVSCIEDYVVISLWREKSKTGGDE